MSDAMTSTNANLFIVDLPILARASPAPQTGGRTSSRDPQQPTACLVLALCTVRLLPSTSHSLKGSCHIGNDGRSPSPDSRAATEHRRPAPPPRGRGRIPAASHVGRIAATSNSLQSSLVPIPNLHPALQAHLGLAWQGDVRRPTRRLPASPPSQALASTKTSFISRTHRQRGIFERPPLRRGRGGPGAASRRETAEAADDGRVHGGAAGEEIFLSP